MARKANNHPTDAELAILRVLWRRGPSTVRQVHEAVVDDTDWALATVKTMLRRMEAKGLLKLVPDREPREYTAARTRRSLVSRSVERFLDTVLDGSLAPLVGYIAKSRGLSAADVAELERLLADGEDEA